VKLYEENNLILQAGKKEWSLFFFTLLYYLFCFLFYSAFTAYLYLCNDLSDNNIITDKNTVIAFSVLFTTCSFCCLFYNFYFINKYKLLLAKYIISKDYIYIVIKDISYNKYSWDKLSKINRSGNFFVKLYFTNDQYLIMYKSYLQDIINIRIPFNQNITKIFDDYDKKTVSSSNVYYLRIAVLCFAAFTCIVIAILMPFIRIFL
jgi:hypothetical protein